MNKIIKYLKSLGIECIYDRSYTGRHYNGRSFYNDGTYSADVYILSNGYEIHHKTTGRPFYWLYKNHNVVIGGCTQNQFIDFGLKRFSKE